jgi:hypothetical protein
VVRAHSCATTVGFFFFLLCRLICKKREYAVGAFTSAAAESINQTSVLIGSCCCWCSSFCVALARATAAFLKAKRRGKGASSSSPCAAEEVLKRLRFHCPSGISKLFRSRVGGLGQACDCFFTGCSFYFLTSIEAAVAVVTAIDLLLLLLLQVETYSHCIF